MLFEQIIAELRADTPETCDLSNKKLTLEQIQQIADALLNSKRLKSLILDNTSLTSDGAQIIARSLATNQTLQKLSLKGLRIGVEGIQAIVSAILANPNTALAELNLSDNQIAIGACKVIANLLKADILSTINLSANEIGDQGAKLLAEALPKEHASHLTLDLSSNTIMDNGVSLFALALQNGASVTLDFRKNKTFYKGRDSLVAALESGKCAPGVQIYIEERLISANLGPAMKEYHKKQQEKGLAFASGSHSRLGEKSPLSLLPQDLITGIASLAFFNPPRYNLSPLIMPLAQSMEQQGTDISVKANK